MNTNTGIVLAITALVVAGGIVYVFLPIKSVPQQNVQNAQEVTQGPTLVLQGTVTGVDANKMQITLQASTASSLKIAIISQATKIEKIISQKDANGTVEKQAVIEVNIEDVQKGSLVTVFYQSEKDGVLSNVSRITFVIEGNVEAYFKSQATNQTSYLKGQVVAIDIAGKNLTYKPVIFDTVSTTTTMSVTIYDGIPVYRVDDPLRASIIHARTIAKITDIQPNQTIFIMADAVALKTGKIVPQALIISEK